MPHYIIRNFLIIFGIPLVAWGILHSFNWYANMTERHDLAPLSVERVQFPLHNPWGVGGVNRFGALTAPEQAQLMALLDRSITALDPWLDGLDRDGFSLLCLGENHDGHLRNLMASKILSRLPTDALLLEGRRTDAARILRHVQARDYVPLLGQNIRPVVLAAKAANPAVRVLGIEETRPQYDARFDSQGQGREASIEQNLRAVYKPGKRHIVLFGAFHCSQRTKLYSRLMVAPPDTTPMLNIRVTREHIEAPIETFVYFLDEIGFLGDGPTGELSGDIVITDTAALATYFRHWFPFFTSNELEHYGALVIMRPLRYPPPQKAALPS